ncbi:GWT1-domain-containing protein [Cystobasidium minutum MCA 4210]|uniref:GWT1-domain-containing protein n=1 Tax=Cystobasidium minutum MCA 4210 TaxID=1397322 RepID=UPI0034CEBB3F|eukprot:jgi/Rhomi1/99296/CE99295_570
MDYTASDNSYKLQKEAFVSHNDGDTVLDINKVCWTAVSTYQLWQAVQSRSRTSGADSSRTAVIEYIILVLPLVLALTVFAHAPVYFNAFLYMLIGLVRTLRRRQPSSVRQQQKTKQENQHVPLVNPFHKSLVTVWRAHMMLMTVICILAVDFPAFPRSFGKTESWGTSLMDLGVGSFVFSLGLTTAPSLLKRIGTHQNPPSILSALGKTWIILLLGFIRLAMVKGTEYPEHVTEYGVHWNFFFTLSLLPIFGGIAERWSRKISFKYMALIVTAAHQLLLVATPLQQYTLNDRRPNLLAQNKEGLVSFAGYLAIYLLGYDTGLYVLPPDPYYIHRRDKHDIHEKPNLGKLLNVLFSYSVIWWGMFGVIHLVLPAQFQVSRRLANTSYVLWVAAFNVSFLCLYLAVDLFGFAGNSLTKTRGPALFDALNRNSLAVFLVANLLTGLVNVSMKTMYASDTTAVLVLLMYTGILVTFAWQSRHLRLKI